MKLFGKKKKYDNLAARIANFMMRCLAEAKSRFNSRDQIEAEFRRRMGYLIPHYTIQNCSRECPCNTFPYVAVKTTFRIATQSCYLSAYDDFGLKLVFAYLDTNTLNCAACVCWHWNAFSTNYLGALEKRSAKKILTDKVPELTEIVNNFLLDAKLVCHKYHTCIVESTHNMCLAFGEKRLNYYSSFEGMLPFYYVFFLFRLTFFRTNLLLVCEIQFRLVLDREVSR